MYSLESAISDDFIVLEVGAVGTVPCVALLWWLLHADSNISMFHRGTRIRWPFMTSASLAPGHFSRLIFICHSMIFLQLQPSFFGTLPPFHEGVLLYKAHRETSVYQFDQQHAVDIVPDAYNIRQVYITLFL